jgi:hypothetical protein
MALNHWKKWLPNMVKENAERGDAERGSAKGQQNGGGKEITPSDKRYSIAGDGMNDWMEVHDKDGTFDVDHQGRAFPLGFQPPDVRRLSAGNPADGVRRA